MLGQRNSISDKAGFLSSSITKCRGKPPVSALKMDDRAGNHRGLSLQRYKNVLHCVHYGSHLDSNLVLTASCEQSPNTAPRGVQLDFRIRDCAVDRGRQRALCQIRSRRRVDLRRRLSGDAVSPQRHDADRYPRHRARLPSQRARRRRSEEHTSELQSPYDLVCRLLLEKKKKKKTKNKITKKKKNIKTTK